MHLNDIRRLGTMFALDNAGWLETLEVWQWQRRS